MLTTKDIEKVSFYMIHDLPRNVRVHQWGYGEEAKFAIGQGPIKDIAREEAERIVGRRLE
jgi:hypothetical protein